MSGSELAKTALHDWHAAHGGRMVDFAGWSMPVQYGSIVAEHQAARNAAALFDVSHMGRLTFEGPDAGKLLDRLVTRRVLDMSPGRVRYGLMTNEAGGILDDVLVYCLEDGRYSMVVNAGNREKIVAWLARWREGFDVKIADRTKETAMIAVQGPLAREILAPLADADLAGMKYYRGQDATIAGVQSYVSRTGYTGEDGFELVVPNENAAAVWEKVLESGRSRGAMPAGLAARDTLRLEAAMPLYGHELSETINPIQAGLQFAVNLDREFVGREAIVRFAQDPAQPQRVGLELTGRRVPREHYPITRGEELLGEVTSGTFSPTLDKPIAMGYVRPEFAAAGGELEIDIRGRRVPATVVPLPFYKRRS